MDRRFERALQTIVSALGLLQAFYWRNAMDADGMSYLDVAQAYSEGDLGRAINGYWSPLYSWLIMAANGILRPSPRYEFAVAHGVSYCGFLLSLLAFAFFMRALFTHARHEGASEERTSRPLLCVGYALFLYASVELNNIGRGGPDFFLAALFYAALALLLRMVHDHRSRSRDGGLLGAALGMAYLAKAVMLPISGVLLGCAAIRLWREPKGRIAVLAAAGAFAIFAAPWIAVLSHSKGRLTYGDTGKLNYAWYVTDASIRHARAGPVHGTPLHSTRRLSSGPAIYEFAKPLRGTYAVWYDPSYWHDGIKARPKLRLQIHRLALSAEDILRLTWFYPTTTALLALGLVAGTSVLKRAAAQVWFVIVPVVAGIGLYSLVLLLGRHIAPFAVAGATALMIVVHSRLASAAPERSRFAESIAVALAVALTVMSLAQLLLRDRRYFPAGHPQFTAAMLLPRYGVPPGSEIGLVGDAMHSYWAHLAKVRIIAEVTPEESALFWAQSPSQLSRQLEIFRSTGAVAVLADSVPEWADREGWVQIEKSRYWINRLRGP